MHKLVVLVLVSMLAAPFVGAEPAWYDCEVKAAGANVAMGTPVIDVVIPSQANMFVALSFSGLDSTTRNQILAAAYTALSAGKILRVAFDMDAMSGNVVVPLAVYASDASVAR